MQHNFVNLARQRFGRWYVAGPCEKRGNKIYWRCICRCPARTERWVNGESLRSDKSTNCGCIRREKVAARNTRHGKTYTREYVNWCGMIARCENPNHKAYQRYGGRGIKVCPRWRESFREFFRDMGVPPSPRHTLDRIDNDGDYEPRNCRWVLNKKNCRNRPGVIMLTYRGVSLPLNEWAERKGLPPKTVYARIRRGWSVHQSLTTPVKP